MSFEVDFKDWPLSNGRLRYGHVSWDSEIFGFSFYQLTLPDDPHEPVEGLPELVDFLLELSGGKCLLFLKVDSWHVARMKDLAERGFYPVETILEPYRNLRTFEISRRFERLQLRPAGDEDRTTIVDMARRAFTRDRYHLDPNLPDEPAAYRYQYWLENGLSSGDPVYVYEDTKKGYLLGFFHIREESPGVIDLSLAAIDPESQKGGLGALMYGECLAECKRLGFRQAVTRISVSNIAVLNIYAHLGFLFRHPKTTWHYYADQLS